MLLGITICYFAGPEQTTTAGVERRLRGRGPGSDDEILLLCRTLPNNYSRSWAETSRTWSRVWWWNIVTLQDLNKQLQPELSGDFEDVVPGLMMKYCYFAGPEQTTTAGVERRLRGRGPGFDDEILLLCRTWTNNYSRSWAETSRTWSWVWWWNIVTLQDLTKQLQPELSGDFEDVVPGLMMKYCYFAGPEQTTTAGVERRLRGRGPGFDDEILLLCRTWTNNYSRSWAETSRTWSRVWWWNIVTLQDLTKQLQRELSGDFGDVVLGLMMKYCYFAGPDQTTTAGVERRLWGRGSGADDEILLLCRTWPNNYSGSWAETLGTWSWVWWWNIVTLQDLTKQLQRELSGDFGDVVLSLMMKYCYFAGPYQTATAGVERGLRDVVPGLMMKYCYFVGPDQTTTAGVEWDFEDVVLGLMMKYCYFVGPDQTTTAGVERRLWGRGPGADDEILLLCRTWPNNYSESWDFEDVVLGLMMKYCYFVGPDQTTTARVETSRTWSWVWWWNIVTL